MDEIDRVLEEVFTRREALQAKKNGPRTARKAGPRYLHKPPPRILSRQVDEWFLEACNEEEDQAQEAFPGEEEVEQWEQWEQEAYPADECAGETFPIAEEGEEWQQEEYLDEGGEERDTPIPAPELTPTKNQQFGPHPMNVPLNAGWKGKGKNWGPRDHPTALTHPQVIQNLIRPIDKLNHPPHHTRKHERMVRPIFQVRPHIRSKSSRSPSKPESPIRCSLVEEQRQTRFTRR